MGRFLTSKLVRWGVTLALVAYAASFLRSEDIREVANLRGALLVLGVSAALTVVVALNAVRWWIIAHIVELKMSCVQSLQWTLIGHFFNQVLPSSIGGDVVRGVLAGRQTSNMGATVTSIALERIVGFLALIMLIIIGQPLLVARLNDTSPTWVALALATAAFLALMAPFVIEPVLRRHFSGRLADFAHRFCTDAKRLLGSPLLASIALLGAFAMHGTNLVLTAMIANELGAKVSLLDVLLVMPTIVLVASLPISIGGWGVREAGLAVGFTALGQPAAVAVATSIVLGLGNLLSGLPGAGVWGLLPAPEARAGREELGKLAGTA